MSTSAHSRKKVCCYYDSDTIELIELMDEEQGIPSESSSTQGSNTPSLPDKSLPIYGTRKRHSQTMLNTFVDTVTELEQDKIWCALAKAVYVSGHALSIFEEPLWVDAFKIIRPALHLPSRHHLSNSLLDQQFLATKDEVKQKIAEAQSICLQCDGFINNRSESISNFVITTPEPCLYKSIHTGVNHHTTEYLFREICNVIEEVGAEKVIAFTSDNASNVKSTWPLIESKYPHITAFGCAAHGLNLLVDDILELPTAKDLLTKVKSIIGKIRKSPILKAQFERMQKEDQPNSSVLAVHLPVKTRWSTFANSLKSLLKTKQSLKRLAIHETYAKVFDDVSCGDILSTLFWDQVECFLSILSPIAKWLKILEYDSSRTLSLVPRIFFELEIKLENVLKASELAEEEKATMLSMLEERKSFLRKPLHLAANLLDPREKGLCLSPAEELEATEFISKFCLARGYDETVVLTELANYKMKSGLFSKDFVWKIRDTVTGPVWWGNIPNSQLGVCAAMILNISSTSVATERSFSTYSSIQTNARNRLLKQRSNKLVFLAHNLRGDRRKRRAFKWDEEEDEAFREIRTAKEDIPVTGPSSSKKACAYDLRNSTQPVIPSSDCELSETSESDSEDNEYLDDAEVLEPLDSSNSYSDSESD